MTSFAKTRIGIAPNILARELARLPSRPESVHERRSIGGPMLKLLRGVVRFFSECYVALGEPQQDSAQSQPR